MFDTKKPSIEYLLDHPEEIIFAHQPIFAAKDGSIYGYEMLMRPKPYTPLEFIDGAAKLGRLRDIEEITMIYGMKAFMDANLGGKNFLNTLPEVCMSPDAVEKARSIGGETMKGRNIYEILEYSEREAYAWKMKISAIINSHSMAQLAIDDFGSGENISYSILDEYKPAIVKIDRMYISHIDTNKINQRIVDDMCHEIKKRGILTLAEGVETKEECDYLLTRDIDLMQGYYMGMPVI